MSSESRKDLAAASSESGQDAAHGLMIMLVVVLIPAALPAQPPAYVAPEVRLQEG
jgi:hypothetical protein